MTLFSLFFLLFQNNGFHVQIGGGKRKSRKYVKIAPAKKSDDDKQKVKKLPIRRSQRVVNKQLNNFSNIKPAEINTTSTSPSSPKHHHKRSKVTASQILFSKSPQPQPSGTNNTVDLSPEPGPSGIQSNTISNNSIDLPSDLSSISPLLSLGDLNEAFLDIPYFDMSGEDLFSVERISHIHSSLHNVSACRFKITPQPDLISAISITSMQDLEDVIEKLFQVIIAAFVKLCKPDDIIKFTIDQDQLDVPIILPPRRLLSLSVQEILHCVVAVLQSKKTVIVDQTFFVGVSVIRVIQGGALKTGLLINPDLENLYAKKSVIRVKTTDDNSCLARAILISWASKNKILKYMLMKMQEEGEELEDTALRVKRTCESLYVSWKNPNLDVQDRVLKKLLLMTGLNHESKITIEHIPAFEDVLECGVNIISQVAGNAFVRKASDKARDLGWKNVFVYHHRQDPDDLTSGFHFDAITGLGAFFQVRGMCENCFKLKYDNKKQYCCGGRRCAKCQRKECPVQSKEVVVEVGCRSCKTMFDTLECFAAHKENNVCATEWTCPYCFKRFMHKKRNRADHKCGEYFCISCERYFTHRHECFIRAIGEQNRKKHERDRLLIFFDIETRQSKVAQCSTGNKLPDERCQICRDDVVPCTKCSRCVNCDSTSCGSLQHEAN